MADQAPLQAVSDVGATARANPPELKGVLEKAPTKIDKAILNLIPEEVARKYRLVCYQKDKGSVRIAVENPHDIEALNVLHFLAQKESIKLELYEAKPAVIDDMLGKYSSADRALKEAIFSLKEEDAEESKAEKIRLNENEEILKQAQKGVFQDAPIAKLVQVIIEHAMEGKASDIHIEPVENNYRVRFRVDGILYASLVLPLEVGRAVTARIKILANLKIDEKRKPQDGRFRVEHSGNVVDLRVSTLPVVEGEKVVMRVLDKSEGLADMKHLGLVGRNVEILEKRIREPYGMILITGPTGSGKSTSLYSFLSILNKEEKNIITLEDPVEYFLNGINQSQIKPEIGYTFATGLRSILRQDPNVIMVGEIRDGETAELAIHAALTGHLVFSTLHTNNAIGAIPRLVDMGIEPFLLASSLQAVAAQRLVRRICEHCKTEKTYSPRIVQGIREALKTVTPEEAKKYGVDLSNELKFYYGKGCPQCNESGYKGRLAVVEVLEVSAKLQEIIADRRGAEVEVLEEGRRQGMMFMKQDGILKALQGETTLAEVQRVTEGDLMVDEE